VQRACAFRLFCLLHKYNANMVYAPDRLADAAAVLRRSRAFFSRCRRALAPPPPVAAAAAAAAGSGGGSSAGAVWGAPARALGQTLVECRAEFESALADDLDTPGAIAALLGAMSRTHAVLDALEGGAEEQGETGGAAAVATPPPPNLWPTVRYLATQLRLFGLSDEATGAFDELLPAVWGAEHDDAGADEVAGAAAAAAPEALVEALLSVRAELRGRAVRKESLSPPELWKVCDAFRDELLPALGVEVKDLRDGSYVWEHVGRGAAAPGEEPPTGKA
jgi:cysteinyl-tRNA synthetase